MFQLEDAPTTSEARAAKGEALRAHRECLAVWKVYTIGGPGRTMLATHSLAKRRIFAGAKLDRFSSGFLVLLGFKQ